MEYDFEGHRVELDVGVTYKFNEHMGLKTIRNKCMEFGGRQHSDVYAFKPSGYVGYRLDHRRITGRWLAFTAKELVPCLVAHEEGIGGLTKFLVKQGLEEGDERQLWTLPKYVRARFSVPPAYTRGWANAY